MRREEVETELLGRRPAPQTGRTRRSAPPDVLARGATAGAWQIDELIACGGFGAVYLAHHRVLDRPAAIKVLHRELAQNPAMLQRFVLEARAVNRIGHPNVVDVFDFGELPDGRPFLAMELLGPENLEQRIDARGAFSVDEALEVLEPVVDALGAAHAAGFIHRDLKAPNIGFRVEADGREIVKLLDFGIAKLLEPGDPGLATQRLGTPHAMAPEQIRGERVDVRTDVYALGVLLFHLVTGRYPFEHPDIVEVERLHLEAPPPPASSLAPVSPAIDDVIRRAMAKQPDSRPATAAAFLAEARAAARIAPPGVRVRTLAIHVAMPALDDAALDDAALDQLAATLDGARDLLIAAGWTIALDAMTSLLALRPLPRDPRAARAETIALAARLATHAPGATVAVHVGAAELTPDGRVVGGPVLELGWLPAAAPGVAITADFVDPRP